MLAVSYLSQIGAKTTCSSDGLQGKAEGKFPFLHPWDPLDANKTCVAPFPVKYMYG